MPTCRSTYIVLGLLLTGVAQGEVRTINLDFGNAGVYSGDDGVLSSPGGTFWNEVTVEDATNGNPGFAEAYQLRDEFGVAFDLPFLLPSVNAFATEVTSVVGSGAGPLNDGVTIQGDDFSLSGLVIRELSSESPIEIVVYFANDVASGLSPSTVRVPDDINIQDRMVTSTGGSGSFPGTGAPPLVTLNQGPFDFVHFTNLSPIATTIGFPLLPGVVVGAPFGAEAHIAAVQVRGEFVFTPEPSAGVMAVFALMGATTGRRFTSAR